MSDDVARENIKARDSVVGPGVLGLFGDFLSLAPAVKFHDAVAFGVFNRVTKDGGVFGIGQGLFEKIGEIVPVEKIVAEDKDGLVIFDEVCTDAESVYDAFRVFLDFVMEFNSPLLAVSEEIFESGLIARGSNNENIFDAGTYEGVNRIINHGFVVDGHELFADGESKRTKAGATAAGENDGFHECIIA